MSMTIDEVLNELQRVKQDVEITFDFCGCFPTTVDSWRGIYAEPAIGWGKLDYVKFDKRPTVADVVKELKKAIDGRLYAGWKGGDFSYTGESQLHVDNPGEYTLTELVRVEDCDWQVILHTERED